MDRRHIYILREVLDVGFELPLEIGCANGASTTAFMEAHKDCPFKGLTLCDPIITEPVLKMAQEGSRIRIEQTTSLDALDSFVPFDFICCDGRHDLDYMREEVRRLERRRPRCLMAHDTSATIAGYPHAEGAEFLRRTFATKEGYYALEDNYRRPGEQTERGLFLATTCPNTFQMAKGIFRRWAEATISQEDTSRLPA
jgi:hypothetical protein